MTVVTPAAPADLEQMAELLAEMDRFYGATELDPYEVRIGQIRAALFDDPPAAYALLAWDAEQVVGVASYSFLWPAAGLTQSLYLKELYVAESHRRRGVGEALMQALFELAKKRGCSRVEWTTDEDNPGALSFYEALGQRTYPSKVFYRLEGTDLHQTSE